jgi:hypothetical protein
MLLGPAPIPCAAPPGDPAAAARTAASLQPERRPPAPQGGAADEGAGASDATTPARTPAWRTAGVNGGTSGGSSSASAGAGAAIGPAAPHTGAPLSLPMPGLLAGSPPGAWAATAAALHHLERLLLAHPAVLLECLEAARHAHALPAAGTAAHNACATLPVLVLGGCGGGREP